MQVQVILRRVAEHKPRHRAQRVRRRENGSVIRGESQTRQIGHQLLRLQLDRISVGCPPALMHHVLLPAPQANRVIQIVVKSRGAVSHGG